MPVYKYGYSAAKIGKQFQFCKSVKNRINCDILSLSRFLYRFLIKMWRKLVIIYEIIANFSVKFKLKFFLIFFNKPHFCSSSAFYTPLNPV